MDDGEASVIMNICNPKRKKMIDTYFRHPNNVFKEFPLGA